MIKENLSITNLSLWDCNGLNFSLVKMSMLLINNIIQRMQTLYIECRVSGKEPLLYFYVYDFKAMYVFLTLAKAGIFLKGIWVMLKEMYVSNRISHKLTFKQKPTDCRKQHNRILTEPSFLAQYYTAVGIQRGIH